MRRAVTPAIPPSMYRHFAVITVLLTLGLAMFAEGEGREAQATQVVRPTEPAAPAAFAAPTTTAQGQPSQSGWGDDSDSGFGNPMERLLGGGGSGVIPDLDEIVAPGYSPEYLASLSEEERALLLSGLQENGMLAPEIRGQRSAAINAASSRRSGAASQAE